MVEVEFLDLILSQWALTRHSAKVENKYKMERVTMSPPPPPLWRAASLELGWDMQMQPICLPAPSEAAEQHAASCTHPLPCAGNLTA